MNATVAIEPAYLAIVRDIIDRRVPPAYRTYVFGSRATGVRLKPWSDLDLAIEGPEPLAWDVIGQMKDDFDEALVPWKVDIVDLNAVSPEFRRIVDSHKVPLP